MIIEQLTTSIPQFEVFEKNLVKNTQDEIEKKFNAVDLVTNRLLSEESIVLADLQIVFCYLKKLLTILKAENRDESHDKIDKEIKMYSEKYPFLDSNRLDCAIKTACIDPVYIIKITSKLSTKELATASGVVPSRIRQLADEIPGGIHTDSGWLFPYDAVAWVKNQSGAGRPVKKNTIIK